MELFVKSELFIVCIRSILSYDLKLDNVITVGKVESAKEFYLSKKIMIVPVLSGSGMRIKIIEGMALGKVIISTTIGAEESLPQRGPSCVNENTT